MSNVTFSSPSMARDVTVYAVAGDRGTILSVAKAHKIPIPFDCQDGECGSCLVEVKHLDPTQKYAIALTEKEKEGLRTLGKITKEEIHDAEVNDMPPRYRLACQCFVRNEDILVSSWAMKRCRRSRRMSRRRRRSTRAASASRRCRNS